MIFLGKNQKDILHIAFRCVVLTGVVLFSGILFWGGVQWMADGLLNLMQYQGAHSSPAIFSADIHAAAATSSSAVSRLAPASVELEIAEPERPAITSIEPALPQARAALVVSVQNGAPITLYAKNQNDQLPIASLTKLMTALVVLENYNLDDTIAVNVAAMAQEGEQGQLAAGQVLTVKSLLKIALIESSNRAAYVLSTHIGPQSFVRLMNVRARKLGLAQTHFADVSGLDANSYSSARDVAVLVQYLVEHFPLFNEIVATQSANVYFADGMLHHVMANTNKLLGQSDIVGGKTGWTDAARGCFVVIQRQSQGYRINVILGAEDRFAQMQNLIQTLNPKL